LKPKIVVEELIDNRKDLIKQIVDASEKITLKEDLQSNKSIFIKPNLTFSEYKKGVTTRVEFVDALVEAILSINSETKIIIGEGEGGYNSFSMTETMRKMGFYDIEARHKNVKVLNLSELPSCEVELLAFGKPYRLNLPEIFFTDIDFSITCPLPKVHCMTKITLAYKNQWGCLPDIMRLKNHYVFDEIISQICEKLKFKYAFLDGKYGLDDNGPMVGEPVKPNWFVASNSLGAFDTVVSEMMGVDWRTVGHLKLAHQLGYIPGKNDVEIIGDNKSIAREFKLKRNFWNYPALAAFRSKKLTHLFYLSRWSKLLHDIMYTFRERPL